MRIVGLIIFIFLMPLDSLAREKIKWLYGKAPDIVTPEPNQQGKVWLARVGLRVSHRLFKQTGVEIQIGRRISRLVPDFLFSFASTDYQSIVAVKSPSNDGQEFDLPSVDDPTSEFNRPRKGSDSWSLITMGPGVGYMGKLFPTMLPLLSQRARFALNYILATDKKNDVGFSGFSFTFEGGLQYQFTKKSPFGVDFNIAYHSGWVISKEAQSKQLGRLPINYFTFGLSGVIWL